MQIAQGRNFSREISSDTSNAILINQTAVEKLGWKDPLNKRIYFGQQDSVGLQVVGVVKDFHFIGMQQVIEPVVLFPITDSQAGLIAARIEKGRIPDAMKYAESKWREIFPQYPFKYSFMDDEFDTLYRRDINSGKIINLFSGLAIFIACLGLFGLASFSITQRTKEIGVRKTLGASAGRITTMLALDFLKWVALANLFAWPLAYFAMKKWLESFAYRTDITLVIFFIAAGVSLTIAILTVIFQSVKASLANPIKSLRYE
jgi:putative ABC transport system permease protein